MLEIEPTARERPGIIHLMVAVGCIAAVLAYTRAIAIPMQLPKNAVDNLNAIFASVGLGAAIAGLLLVIWRRAKGIPCLTYPGEWLLVACGIYAVHVLVAGYLLWLNFPIQNGTAEWERNVSLWFLGLALTAQLLIFLVYLAAAFNMRAASWRTYFSVASLINLLTWAFGAAGFGASPSLYAFPVVTLMLLAVVAIDLKQRRRHPWTHWLGIGMTLWFPGFNAMHWLLG